MTGSRTTLAVCAVTAPLRASASPYGTKTTGPGRGSNGVRLAGWPVMASAPRVRPWKEPSAATQPPPGRSRRESFRAASLASAPELVNSTRLSGPEPTRAWSRSASSMPGACAARLLVCPSVATCLLTASTTAGWAWPSRLTAMPPSRSTYARPSTSQTVAPLPRASTTGGVP